MASFHGGGDLSNRSSKRPDLQSDGAPTPSREAGLCRRAAIPNVCHEPIQSNPEATMRRFYGVFLAAAALLAVLAPSAAHAQSSVLVVDTTADDPSLTGCDASAPADCSLRGALLVATAGDAIDFDTGVFPTGSDTIIAVTSQLPEVSVGTLDIDGHIGSTPTPRIIVTPAPGATVPVGLLVTSSDNAIGGIRFDGFAEDGIRVDGGANNELGVFSGCRVVWLNGNGQYGLRITGEGADNNRVQGGRIGVTAPNGAGGVLIEGGADNNMLYGSNCRSLLIAGNGGPGVTVRGDDSSNNQIKAASMGAASVSPVEIGSASQPNDGPGVLIEGGTGFVLEDALIYYNHGAGVAATGGSGSNLFSTESFFKIYDNDGLAIDLGNDGVTANDPSDDDDGPNGLLNAPEITSVVGAGAGSVTVSGTACPSCTVYLYEVHEPADASGHGELQRFRGNVTASGSGAFSKTITLTLGGLVTAGARAPNGDCSELSANAAGPRVLVVDTTADDPSMTACTDGAVDCSLHGALSVANAGDTIDFDASAFPTNSNTVIQLTTALPAVSVGTLTIDGHVGNGPTPYVTVEPAPGADIPVGLHVTSSGNAVGGMAFRGFSEDGIRVDDGAGNEIGIFSGCKSVDLNGNGQYGLRIRGEGADGNVVSGGNFGNVAANGAGGVLIEGGADSNTFHGSNCTSLKIAGNDGPGLTVRGDSDGNAVRKISHGAASVGFTEVGMSSKPNTGDGVLVEGGSGFVLDYGRVVGNGGAGVRITGGSGARLFNSQSFFQISGNAGLPIDHGAPGVTDNADGDGIVDFPVITSVEGAGAGTVVVTGTACPGCRVWIFEAASPANASGHGGIAKYRTQLTANGTTGAFSTTISLTLGAEVVAGAQDTGTGDCSELSANAAGPRVLVVDTLADDATLTGCQAATPDDCSLHGALATANSGDTVDFDGTVFPSNASRTIQISQPLPDLTVGKLTIDGHVGNGPTPYVVVTPATDVAIPVGLHVVSDDNAIGGVAFNGFAEDGVRVEGANNALGVFSGCKTLDLNGNGLYGLRIRGENADGNVVSGGNIGTAAPNGAGGVLIEAGADNNTLHGSNCTTAKLAGNGGPGLTIRGDGSDGNAVRKISYGSASVNPVDLGSSGKPNAGAGVRIEGGHGFVLANARVIGNDGPGVEILGGSGHRFDGTESYYRIADNGGLAIDLGGDGVTPNDGDDSDEGPNALLNTPIIRSIAGAGGVGVFDVAGLACPGCRVYIWRATEPEDETEHGELERYLTQVSADAYGAWSTQVNLGFTPTETTEITAIARDTATNDMSEVALNANILEFLSIPDVCGNGAQEPSEECDDNNTVSGDGCSEVCTTEGCGDGVVQPLLGETCDAPTCPAPNDCMIALCESCGCAAPTPLAAGTSCDDGDPGTTGDACNGAGACVFRCGDGDLDPGEECDDGNLGGSGGLPQDGCSDACGVESGWVCDDAEPSACRLATDVSVAIAFDPAGVHANDATVATITVGNETDNPAPDVVVTVTLPDGLGYLGDDCVEDLGTLSCSLGTLSGGASDTVDLPLVVAPSQRADLDVTVVAAMSEEDVAPSDNLATGTITVRYCGDGTWDQDDGEACDDGNLDDTDGCVTIAETGQCAVATCGDGFVRADGVDDEACDDGDENSDTLADACRMDCTVARCGDGVTDSGEACDDGNDETGDSCPSGPEGTCQDAVCGDGFVFGSDHGGTEGCDDAPGSGNFDACPNDPSTAGGLTTCQPAVCGDGFVRAGLGDDGLPYEDCDGETEGCFECVAQPGYTCSGDTETSCVASCGTLFDFAGGAFGWAEAADGDVPFAFDDNASAYVVDSSAPPAGEVAHAAIYRRVAVPASADAGAPMVEVDYSAAGVQVCVSVFVSERADPIGDPVASSCAPTTGTETLSADLSAWAGASVIVTIAVDAGTSAEVAVTAVRVVSDADGDGIYELASNDTCDGCVDVDEDGFGDGTSADPSTCGGGDGLDCDDAVGATYPGAVEACSNGIDDDCDGDTDDDDGESCGGETCALAATLSCGDVVTVDPVSADVEACGGGAGMSDAVFALAAGISGPVEVRAEALGERVFALQTYQGTCGGSCDGAAAGTCSGTETLSFDVAVGQSWFVAAKEDAACGSGGGAARVSLACVEQCGGGVDEDLDERTDCADDDCVADAACADEDLDDDGFDNGDELGCGTDPNDEDDYPTGAGAALGDDGAPLCAHDADEDGFYDAWEVLCGSDEDDSDETPVDDAHDRDQDGTCDALDGDDDDDTYDDALETLCGADPLDAASTPLDADHNHDEDETCDALDTDDDDDGFPDVEEDACGTSPIDAAETPLDALHNHDSDDVCDALDEDDDDDGFLDADEDACGSSPIDAAETPLDAAHDFDGDDVCDLLDDDDDDDGVSDVNELAIESDPLDPDTDDDGLDDGVENANHDDVIDDDETSPLVKDTDDDGLEDGVEHDSCYPTTAEPDGDCEPTLGWVADTDDDGVLDGFEDADHDGVLDPGETNPVVADSDGDGFEDGEEVECLSDPLDPTSFPRDLNENQICDGMELDSDGDQVPDFVETFCGTDPEDASSTPAAAELLDTDDDGLIDCGDDDDDGDGIPDADELLCETDPKDAASLPVGDDAGDPDGDEQVNCADADDDGDGLDDVDEVETDPRDADSDDDGLSDGDELSVYETDPTLADTDEDGLLDGLEVGVTEPLPDTDEAVFVADADPSTVTDPRLADTDTDCFLDGEEDADGNGRVDDGEFDPNDGDDHDGDTDEDGLADYAEHCTYGTDWQVADSDGGGVSDGDEVDAGTDPNDASDDAPVTPQGYQLSGGGGCTGGGAGGLLLLLLGLPLVVLLRRRRGGATHL